jgi:hypothetical protein
MLLLEFIRLSTQKYELRTSKQFIESLKMALIMLDMKTTFGNIVRDQSVSICMLQFQGLWIWLLVMVTLITPLLLRLHVYTLQSIQLPTSWLGVPESRHGSTTVPGHAHCPAIVSLHDRAHDRWLHRVHIFTRDETGLVCQGNRYGKEKAGGTARPWRTKSHLPGHSPPASQASRRVGLAL